MVAWFSVGKSQGSRHHRPGASGEHIWTERFERDPLGVFELQDEICKSIVGALRLKLLHDEKRGIEHRETRSVAAYDHYLRARHVWLEGFSDE